MKLFCVGLAIVIALNSCSKKGSSSLEELSATIEKAIKENKSKQIGDSVYWEGADPEVRKIGGEVFEGFVFSGLDKIDVQTLAFDDFKPKRDLPGVINGRPLKWLVEPSHWIIIKASRPDGSKNHRKLNLEMAAGQVNGKWYLMGCTYDGKAPEKISLPGLTDRNATAIAFNKDGEVVDFVTITPDSNIEEIVFKAPENGDDLSVTVVGPSVHEDIPENLVISSSVAKYMMGKVRVHVADGVVTGIFGNGMSQGSPLDEADLKGVLEKCRTAIKCLPSA